MRLFFQLIPSLLLILSLSPAQARGLDDLKPNVKKPAKPNLAKPNTPAKPNPAKPNMPAKPQTPKKEDAEKVKDKLNVPEQEKQEEPSELSKSLVDKLYFATNYGFATISGDTGNWSTQGTGDFSVGFRAVENIIPKMNLFATFRYHPMDVVVKEEDTIKQSYRGSVEGFLFGAAAFYRLQETLDIAATVELGMMTVGLNKIDESIRHNEDLESSGVNFAIGGGADWHFLEKMRFGPRIYVGAGQFTTTQIGANIALLF